MTMGADRQSATSTPEQKWYFSSAFVRRPLGIGRGEWVLVSTSVVSCVLELLLGLGPLHGIIVGIFSISTSVVIAVICIEEVSVAALIVRIVNFVWHRSQKQNDPRSSNWKRLAPEQKITLNVPTSVALPVGKDRASALSEIRRPVVIGGEVGILIDTLHLRAVGVIPIRLRHSPYLSGAWGLGELHRGLVCFLDSLLQLEVSGLKLTMINLPGAANHFGFARRGVANSQSPSAGAKIFEDELEDVYTRLGAIRSGPMSFLAVGLDVTPSDRFAYGTRSSSLAAQFERVRSLGVAQSGGVITEQFLSPTSLRELVEHLDFSKHGVIPLKERFDRLSLRGFDLHFFSISRWPQGLVVPGFYGHLLNSPTSLFASAVTLAPISPSDLLRHTRMNRTNSLASARIRKDSGFLESSSESRGATALKSMESEQLAGRIGIKVSANIAAISRCGGEAGVNGVFATKGIVLKREFGRQFECLTRLQRLEATP